MQALESAGLACVVRAGPDLFSEPEVLLLLGALGISAGQPEFIGSPIKSSNMPNRIRDMLGCDPKPEAVRKAAAKLLRQSGLTFDRSAKDRLLLASEAIRRRISEGHSYSPNQIAGLRSPGFAGFSDFEKSASTRFSPTALLLPAYGSRRRCLGYLRGSRTDGDVPILAR
jgi:DNA helicase-2/ATP-dependent DNA helicase PcrA